MVALATAANWRLALLAALTAAAIAATRIRYARLGALFLLVAVLGLAAAGASAGSDDRAAAHAASRSACASVVAAHGQRLAAVRARGASCRTAGRSGATRAVAVLSTVSCTHFSDTQAPL